MDHFNTNSNRATSNAPRFYQRSQSVVDRNGFTTDPLPSISHPPMQNEWPGPPVPVRSERRAAFRRRVRFSSFRLAAIWFMIYFDRFISFFFCDVWSISFYDYRPADMGCPAKGVGPAGQGKRTEKRAFFLRPLGCRNSSQQKTRRL